MLKRFLCWLLGHKTVYKAFTGQTATIDTVFEKDHVVPLMTWEQSKYCLRCGKPVEELKDAQR